MRTVPLVGSHVLVAAGCLLGQEGPDGGNATLPDLLLLRTDPQLRGQMVNEIEGELLTPLVRRCRCHVDHFDRGV